MAQSVPSSFPAVVIGLGTPIRRGHSVVSPVAASSSDQRRVGKSPAYWAAINTLAKLVLEATEDHE